MTLFFQKKKSKSFLVSNPIDTSDEDTPDDDTSDDTTDDI